MTANQHRLLGALLRQAADILDPPVHLERDMEMARRLAADCSRQTGKNRDRILNGELDHSYGVRSAMAGLLYGRTYPK